MSLCQNQTSRFTWKAFWFWIPTGISFAVSSLNAYNTMLYWQYWEGQGVHITIHILCFTLFLAWRLFRRQYCHQPLSSAQQSSHRSKYIEHGTDTPAYHQCCFKELHDSSSLQSGTYFKPHCHELWLIFQCEKVDFCKCSGNIARWGWSLRSHIQWEKPEHTKI